MLSICIAAALSAVVAMLFGPLMHNHSIVSKYSLGERDIYTEKGSVLSSGTKREAVSYFFAQPPTGSADTLSNDTGTIITSRKYHRHFGYPWKWVSYSIEYDPSLDPEGRLAVITSGLKVARLSRDSTKTWLVIPFNINYQLALVTLVSTWATVLIGMLGTKMLLSRTV
jgi:hypothetical protein